MPQPASRETTSNRKNGAVLTLRREEARGDFLGKAVELDFPGIALQVCLRGKEAEHGRSSISGTR
jgi:hypothetical protein